MVLAAREDSGSLEPDRTADGGLAVSDRGVDDIAVIVLDAEIDGHLAGHELPLEAERPVAYPPFVVRVSAPVHVKADVTRPRGRRRRDRVQEVVEVRNREMPPVEPSSPGPHVPVHRVARHCDRPEQARCLDARLEIMNLCRQVAHGAREEIDSDEAKHPERLRPSRPMYVPSMKRMSASNEYVLPSLPRAVPCVSPAAILPRKSVMVDISNPRAGGST